MAIFLFWRSILAHLVADFPMQTSIIYRLKIKGLQGQILHGGILFISSTIFLFPYLHIKTAWIYLFLITFLHIIQDCIKVKYFKTSLYPFWPFLIDQILHFLSTAVIFLFPVSIITPFISSSNIFMKFYNNNLLVYFLIGYIAVTWHGTYFIDTFKKTFLKDNKFFKDTIIGYAVPAEEKYYGIIERVVFTTLAFFGGWFYLLIPLAAGFRFLFKKLSFASISLVGIFLSIIVGTILRIISF